MIIAVRAISAAGVVAALLTWAGSRAIAQSDAISALAPPLGIQVADMTAPSLSDEGPLGIQPSAAPPSTMAEAAPPPVIVASPPPPAAAAPPPSAGMVWLPPPPPPPPPVLPPALGFIDEFKAGGLLHDVSIGDPHEETGVDVNLEVLFKSPAFLSIIGSPRPHLGGDINTSGNTSSGYAGLTWRWDFLGNLINPGDSVFVDGSLGGAIHDGYIDTAPPGRKKLGSRVLFRESAELGYQITPTVSVAAFIDHISNANFGRHNGGDTNAGGRIGFKF